MYEMLKAHTEGSFGGIGIVMGFKDNKVTVISVMEGTPGEAAGIKTGDEIVAVDGKPTHEIEPEEVAMHIRGEVGTNVVLTIRRAGEEDQDYTITLDSERLAPAAYQSLIDSHPLRYGHHRAVLAEESLPCPVDCRSGPRDSENAE